jgi:hypothetical protein
MFPHKMLELKISDPFIHSIKHILVPCKEFSFSPDMSSRTLIFN